MRDEARFLSGRKITSPPHLFLGAAANPFAPPYDFRAAAARQEDRRPARSSRRRSTCFDVPMFESFMRQVRDLGLHEKCFILVGVGPLASAKAARWIRSNVPGIHIPDAVIARLEGAQNQKLEGKKICIEIMQQCREIEGVAGRARHGLPAGGAGGRDRARIRACSPGGGRGGARRARTTPASWPERLQNPSSPTAKEAVRRAGLLMGNRHNDIRNSLYV